MELSIFLRSEVLQELKKYVEVRLHTDKDSDASRALQELKQKRLNDVSMPIYEIVDPRTLKVIDIYRGADILSGGAKFKEFLARNAR
jgi:hypothetical protein